MSLSLYSRAMLSIGTSLTVITALSTYVSITERSALLNETLRTRLNEATKQQAHAVSDAFWKLSKEGTEVVLQGLARDPDFLAVRVVDEQGRIFASIGPDDVSTPLAERSEAPILQTEDGVDRTIGTLTLYFSRERVLGERTADIREILRLALLQLAAVLLASGLALRAVVKPIEAITDRMLGVAAGDTTSPVPYDRRPDQVGSIARAVGLFGREMDARREATHALECAHQTLERRIEERTRELRQSEDRFRGLFMGSPLPKWVYSVQTRRFLEVNHAAIVKYGYSREEFLAMRIEDIRPPEDTARLIARLARGPSPSGQEWRHVLRDGTSIDVEIHSHDVTFADESARLVVALDITARKKAERLTQRLFETSQDVILVTDGYGNFTQASPSTMTALGYTPAELMGRNGADFVAPESIEPVRKAMRLCRAGHALPSFRCNYIHKSGSTVALTWMAVWSEQDRRYFFFGRDMTEHDRTENQLRQSQKMEAVGQLTGGVAHDFNNILAVILANVEDLEEHVPPEFLDRVREIDGATQRAAELIKQLLAFSRKQPLRPQRLSLNDLVSTTGKLLRRTLSENIEISSMLAEHLGPCEVDRAQLESALVNLCINGRDAMPDGGRLTIETANVTLDAAYVVRNPDAVAGDYVMLSVTDTGCGMPPEVAAKVFEPFFTTKGPGKGTGLGLSMVYGLVRQSHGHITVHSTPGQGTTIRIYLPRSEVRPEEDSSVERVPLPQGGESVLLVEDNAVVRTSVSRQLRSLGYNVTEAANADEALGVASRGSFDLLLTDIVMPGSANGRVLAQTLEHTCALTKVVYMSGYSDSAIIHDGRLDEGVLLLSKPFRKPELAQMMRRALDN